MTGIFKGGAALTNLAIGSQQVKSVWLGGTLIWTPAAPPAGLTVKQARGINGGGTKSVVFNAAAGWATPTAGNLLIAFCTVSSSGATLPSGFTWLLNTAASTRREWVAYRWATGTESSVTLGAFGAHLLEIAGANASPFAGTLEETFASATTFDVGPLTPTYPNCLAIGAAAWNISNQTGFSADAGWTLVAEGAGMTFSSALAYKLLDASLAPAQVSISANTSQAGGGSFLLVRPA